MPSGGAAPVSLLETISRLAGDAAAEDRRLLLGRIGESMIETARGPDSVAALARAVLPSAEAVLGGRQPGLASFRQLIEAEGREGMPGTASWDGIARPPPPAEAAARPDVSQPAARYLERVAALQGRGPANALAALSQTWHTVTVNALEGRAGQVAVSMSPADYAGLQEELMRQASGMMISAGGPPPLPANPHGLQVAQPPPGWLAAGLGRGYDPEIGYLPGPAEDKAAARRGGAGEEDRMLEGTVE